MVSKSKKSSPASSVALAETAPAEAAAERFVGQWNRLVSTTNWEKGRIICQWREALEQSGAAVTEYSDEAWAQLVGGVSSQHVGRLRRVFQQFGSAFDQYEGLYWSHFQAALDWDDAEMWLEGAIHNRWSVSQMRGQRWETLGHAGEPPAETAAETLDDDAGVLGEPVATAVEATSAAVDAPPWSDADGEASASADDDSADAPAESALTAESAPSPSATPRRKALAVDVDDLPADLAEAFEQFKLAIIAQRRSGWRETTPAAVVECLDALRELTLAPLDD